MSHNRAPKPGSKWYLPYDTYRYVVDFCYAYHDMERKLSDLDGWHSHDLDGMPRGTDMGDPTSREAMKRMRLQEQIDVIRDAVIDTDPLLFDWLLEGVTIRHMTYSRLQAKQIPCSKNEYADLRRQVYWRVAERIM